MNNNKLWYLVYFIGIIALITMLSFNFNEVTNVVLTLFLQFVYQFQMYKLCIIRCWKKIKITKSV